jgi:hypothetical protein
MPTTQWLSKATLKFYFILFYQGNIIDTYIYIFDFILFFYKSNMCIYLSWRWYYLRLHLAIYSLRIRRIFCFWWINPPNMLFIVITDTKLFKTPNKLVIFGGYSRSLLFGSSHYNHCDKLLSCCFVLSINHLSNESKLRRN